MYNPKIPVLLFQSCLVRVLTKGTFLFVLITGFLCSCPAIAQRDAGKFWAVSHASNPYQVILHFDLAPGWKMYGPNNSPGLVPHWVETRKNNIETTTFSWPQEKTFHLYGEEFHGYDAPFSMVLNITPRDPQSTSHLKGALNFAVCQDICIPAVLPVDWAQVHYGQGLAFLLLMAFLGGLLLNIMPCVLPVLSLKVFSVLNKKHPSKYTFATLFGSFTFFMGFALVVFFLRSMGLSAGWGMHFQNPYFVAFFVWLLLILTARFLHLLEVRSPSMTLPIASNFPLVQSFMEGLILALLATPCTAPYLSLAAGVAFTLPLLETCLIFFCLWLGFGLPLFIMAWKPRFLQKCLPTPGKWMGKLEVGLGILLLLSAFWMGWVLWKETTLVIALSVFVMTCLLLSFMYRLPRYRHLLMGVSFLVIFLPMLPYESSKEYDFPLTVEELEDMADKGEVVFVKVHAAWCLTCHANDVVLESQDLEKAFEEAHVQKFSFDWTKRQLGIEAFLAEFDRDGVPFYLLIGPGNKKGMVLPELLTPQTIKAALQKVRGPAA